VDPWAPRRPARLKQQDRLVGLSESTRDCAAGRARADHNIVIRLVRLRQRSRPDLFIDSAQARTNRASAEFQRCRVWIDPLRVLCSARTLWPPRRRAQRNIRFEHHSTCVGVGFAPRIHNGRRRFTETVRAARSSRSRRWLSGPEQFVDLRP
jgi:hypothetical protein